MCDDIYRIGIDIGGTKINIGVVSDEGEVLAKHKIMTRSDKGYLGIVSDIIRGITRVLQQTNRDKSTVRSIGIGVPGTADSKNGIVVFTPNLGWYDRPLIKDLAEEFACDMYLGQDTHAAVLAEYIFGAGRGCSNIICITLGTGIGSGIVINGHLYRGNLNTAGEIGHMIVERDGQLCNCGNRGCLETYSAGPGILREAEKVIAKEGLTTQEVFHLAKEGHQEALKVIENAVNYLGIGLVNIVNTIGPDKILISGGLSNEMDLLIKPLRDFVQQNGHPVAARGMKIEKAMLGEDAPMIGAAILYCDIPKTEL